jgi:two-component system sensor histidine kinase YesM
MSLKQKILSGYLLIICIVLLCISFLMIVCWKQIIRKNISKSIYSSNYQIKKSIDNYFDSVIKLSEFPYLDTEILDILRKNYQNMNSASKVASQISDIETITPKLYKHIYYMHNQIDAIWLYPAHMDYYAFRSRISGVTGYKVTSESWFHKVKEGNGKPYIIGVHKENAVNGDWNVISIARGIMDPDTGDYLGMIVIDCSVDNFARLWDSSEYSESIFAVSDKNNKLIIPYPEEQTKGIAEYLSANADNFREGDHLYQIYLEGQTWYAAVTKLNYMDGRIYHLVPIGNALRSVAYTFALSVICMLVLGILLVSFSVKISRTITQPMEQLISTMESVESGNLSPQTEEYYGEMAILSQKFNHMVRRIEAMFTEAKEQEREKHKMEMLALQSQINPHFLYNTLNSIRWLSELQGADKVTQMLDELVKLLRFAAEDTGEFITVGREVEFIISYIRILNFRYFERFSFVLDIQEEAKQFMIPRFIIQPLVENSVLHGFDSNDICATVRIDVHLEGKELLLCVTDDGKGLSPEKIEEILSTERKSERSLNKIGVYNVNQRIKLTYGKEHAIKIDSMEGCYTKVTIRIPAQCGRIGNEAENKGSDSR